ncbi:MAG: cell division protein ZapA [Alphaproteobacteria bacterium]|nr:cell division protein ZapA [Alphaproteobacteria bacterium]MBE8220014.1 cell division protein ZapA [Alphaproteobacteria bacterium]
MAEVTVSINSRMFQVACANGEEAQVLRLAEDLSARVSDVRREGSKASDSHMLVLVGLTLCSELRDLQRDIDAVKDDINKAETSREALSQRLSQMEESIASAITDIAVQLEASQLGAATTPSEKS